MDAKTREQILIEKYSSKIMNWQDAFKHNPSFAEAAHEAMDEYAKQEAIGFAEFISKAFSTCELDEDKDEYGDPLDDGQFQRYSTHEYFTIEELYQLYLQSKK